MLHLIVKGSPAAGAALLAYWPQHQPQVIIKPSRHRPQTRDTAAADDGQ